MYSLADGLETELSVSLVGQEIMKRLNSKYFGRDEVTDVIAFPQMTSEEMERLENRGRGGSPEPLGDIVICVPRARSQAEARGHEVSPELELLAVHGLLHLLGYEDSSEEGSMEMVAIQEKILNRSIIP